MPAKECNVIPLMCDAAIPVLAVANVCSGGRAPTIVSLCYDHNGSCFQILSIKMRQNTKHFYLVVFYIEHE